MKNQIETHDRSKKLIILGIIFCLPMIFLAKIPKAGAQIKTQAVADHLVVNEVLYDPSLEPGGEWIEIYNPTSSPVDLSDYKLGDGEGTYKFPESVEILAYHYMVIANDATVFFGDYGFYPSFEIISDTTTPNMIHVSGSINLANAGDEVLLFDNADAIVDLVNWGSSSLPAPSVSAGHSIERQPAGEDTNNCSVDFVEAVPTPFTGLLSNHPPTAVAGPDQSGLRNQALTFDGSASTDPDGNTPLSYSWDFGDGSSATGISVTHSYVAAGNYSVTLTVSDFRGGTGTDSLLATITLPTYSNSIKINEFLPDPVGSDYSATGEYIELYNEDSLPVDLDGWFLKNSSGTSFEIKGQTIGANGFLTFYRGDTGITITNNGETLYLINPNGDTSDFIIYAGTAPEGQSYNKTASGWSWSTTLTPSGDNVITLPAEEIKSTSTKKSTSSPKPKASATTAPKDTEEEGSILSGSAYAKDNEIDLPGSQPKTVTKGRTFWEYLAWILLGLSASSLIGMRFLLWKKNKMNLPGL